MRTHLDQYATPAFQTVALRKRVKINGRIAEPCCGDGQIVQALRPFAHHDDHFYLNDIDERYAAETHLDATQSELWDKLRVIRQIDWAVTNPPFNRAIEILERAHETALVGVAFLLRLSFLEPTKDFKRDGVTFKGRDTFLVKHPPSKLIVFPRYKYKRGAKGTDSCTTAWMVWYKDHPTAGRPIVNVPIEIVPKEECV